MAVRMLDEVEQKFGSGRGTGPRLGGWPDTPNGRGFLIELPDLLAGFDQFTDEDVRC